MRSYLFLTIISLYVCAQAETNFSNSLVVAKPQFIYNSKDGHSTASVFGDIKNNSNNTYERLVLEVRYFDKDNKLIDTVTKDLYDNVFPANNSASFRIISEAIQAKESYITPRIRILSAEIKKPCNSKKGIKKFLSDWGGLMVVLSFFSLLIYSARNQQKEQEKNRLEFLEIANKQSLEMTKISTILDNWSKQRKE